MPRAIRATVAPDGTVELAEPFEARRVTRAVVVMMEDEGQVRRDPEDDDRLAEVARLKEGWSPEAHALFVGDPAVPEDEDRSLGKAGAALLSILADDEDRQDRQGPSAVEGAEAGA